MALHITIYTRKGSDVEKTSTLINFYYEDYKQFHFYHKMKDFNLLKKKNFNYSKMEYGCIIKARAAQPSHSNFDKVQKHLCGLVMENLFFKSFPDSYRKPISSLFLFSWQVFRHSYYDLYAVLLTQNRNTLISPLFKM